MGNRDTLSDEAVASLEAQLVHEAVLARCRTQRGQVLALTDRRILLLTGRRLTRVISVPYDTVDWVVERRGFEVFADKVRSRLVFTVPSEQKDLVRTILADRVTVTEPSSWLGKAMGNWFRR